MMLTEHDALPSGAKGRKAIDKIAARKGTFEWGAFLMAAAEAPNAEHDGTAAAVASVTDTQVPLGNF
jgi:hypothetical protein